MSKLLTKKYQNNNSKSSAYGKYYGRIVYTETLTTEDLANHISSHGSPYKRSVILGVLAAVCDCLVELTLDSKRVRLGDLGTFYMSAETEGSTELDDFTAGNIKKVHLRFWPNQEKSYALDSVSLRKKASFTDIAQLTNSSSGNENGQTSNNDNSGGGNGGGVSDPIEDRP